MFSKTERMLAFRYLKSRKRTGFVSVIAGFSFLGIMLGVATLIIVMSVMNGFREELMNRVLGINGQLGVYPAWGSTLDAVQEKVDKMQKIDGVVQAIPVVDGQVMVSSKETSAGVMVRGMTAEDFDKRPLLGGQYKGWELSEFTDGQVILGYRLARKLAVRSGDDVTLVSPKGNVTAFGTLPKMKAYTVIGTFNSGMSEYDANFIFMPLTEAQKF
ncbi:MAG: ABC transporter permease, partial [Alphaproteobacteria bacterium]|nr:ABC transporter permease [Alphaproteobacteria bacterium]